MRSALLAFLAIAAVVLAGCTGNTPPSTASTPAASTPAASTPASTPSMTPTPTPMAPLKADLLGDGSTFVAPLMDKWRTTFTQANSGVTLSYTGGGSGKGRGDITKNLVDFAGSDAPMSAAEQANATDVLHIPVAAGSVVLAYNVPELSGVTLKFDGDTLAKIFLGSITKWNDPAIAALNPGVALPAEDIGIVHRSDGSGTTATFTDYLNKVSPDWASKVGKGSTVNWPVGTGANGNAGVGSQIQQTPYAFGYIGAEWGNISKIQVALMKNKAGQFVAGAPAGASAALDAALAAGAFDENLKGSATNQDGAASYPITAVTWVLVHQHQTDAAKGKALVAFLHYVLHDGQSVNQGLNYAPLPASLVTKGDTMLAKVDANGQSLMATM